MQYDRQSKDEYKLSYSLILASFLVWIMSKDSEIPIVIYGWRHFFSINKNWAKLGEREKGIQTWADRVKKFMGKPGDCFILLHMFYYACEFFVMRMFYYGSGYCIDLTLYTENDCNKTVN